MLTFLCCCYVLCNVHIKVTKGENVTHPPPPHTPITTATTITNKHTHKQANKQTYRQTNRRKTNKQRQSITNKQTNRPASPKKQTNGKITLIWAVTDTPHLNSHRCRQQDCHRHGGPSCRDNTGREKPGTGPHVCTSSRSREQTSCCQKAEEFHLLFIF